MIRGFDFFGGSLPPIKMPELRTKFRPFLKNWRRPTLAESIQALPSARLCLTAEFGMGSGRTTALWPPRNMLTGCRLPVVGCSDRQSDQRNFKEQRWARRAHETGNNPPHTTNNEHHCSL